jgi:hypothetical protein
VFDLRDTPGEGDRHFLNWTFHPTFRLLSPVYMEGVAQAQGEQAGIYPRKGDNELKFMGFLFVLLTLAGCGGGSSSSAPPVTSRSFLWVTNSGAIVPGDPANRVGSSFTCDLTLKGANTDGTDSVTSYDCPGSRPIAQTLRSSGSVKVGTFQLEESITTADGGAGRLVGIARAVVSITSAVPVDSQGHQTPDFQIDTTAAAVDSITLPSGQRLRTGTSAPLIFTAHPTGATSHILALAPNSEVVQITSGADHLSYSNGIMTGLVPGIATLTVTARGITSAPTTVIIDNQDRP